MDNLIGDFSVNFEGEVEEVNSYDDEFTDEVLYELVVLMVKGGHLNVGERSEGSIYVSKKLLKFKYRMCVSVGKDWGLDKWKKCKTILSREGLI
jgi:hypothetical protein